MAADLPSLNERVSPVIIAIDGPAGSGKSSTAKAVASRLGALYLDTGAMYRAVALYFLDENLALESNVAEKAISDIDIRLDTDGDSLTVHLNGVNVTDRIRETDVTEASSVVSRLEPVRRKMVALQRQIALDAARTHRSVVMEGRDIGTVVFPEADLKFFMVADLEERVRRRIGQLNASGTWVEPDQLRIDMKKRDERDANRSNSPLRKADDAVELDTSRLTFEEQVAVILQYVDGLHTGNAT